MVAEKPKRGGTWKVAGELPFTPPTLDQARGGGAASGLLRNIVSCRLVMWDERPDRPGSNEVVIPDLAERWENSADGKVWTFYLRKGVLLPPPSNREVTAEDWLKSELRRIAVVPRGGMGSSIPAMYTDPVTGKFDYKKPNIEVLDTHTVRVTLSEPDADFLSVIGGHSGTALFFPEFYGPHKDGWGEQTKAEHFKGCGPFMMSEYVPGANLTYVRNPNYYDKELPYVDKVEHPFIFDPLVAAAALRAGELDSWGMGIILPLSVGRDLEKVPGLKVTWSAGATIWPYHFDLNRPPWNDVRVRRAFALSIDRKSWINKLYFGRGQNIVLMEPRHLPWNLPPEKMGEAGRYYTAYDPEEAKRLLKEAGYPNGFSFEFQHTNAAAHVTAYPMNELVKSYLEAIGVTMNINIIDRGATGTLDPPTGGIRASGLWRPEFGTYVHSIIHYQGKQWPSGAKHPFVTAFETDPEYRRAVALMEEQKRTVDVKKRLELVHELQRVWAQGIWHWNFPIPDSPIVNRERVRGYNTVGGWSGGSMKYVWLAE